MRWSFRVGSIFCGACCAAMLCCPLSVTAAEPDSAASGEPLGLFAAVEQGRLEARLIAKDSKRCNLLLKNLSDVPLSVELPTAFAGVPVLAQWQGIGNNGNNGNNAPQQLGVGVGPQRNRRMNPMMNLPGQNRQGPNLGNPPLFGRPMFNIPPEKVLKLRLPAVCLDHGHPNPRAAIPYEIKPLSDCTKKPGIAELCAMLGRKELDQRVVQLAAWHINNGVSWKDLAAKRRQSTLPAPPTYSKKEIDAAKEAVADARKAAKENETAARETAVSYNR